MPAFPILMLLTFALTLFCSATLLFMVQPMVGKMILPLLGGTPEVWNTCMVFFQALLLAGYAYAHASTKYLGIRKQAAFHLVLLLIPFLFLPISVNKSLIQGGVNPIPAVMLVLLFSVGVPFFVISTSAPMLQRWFSSTDHPSAHDPYFLYGASNLGSMLTLVAYPLLIEPNLRLGPQTWVFAVGYGLLVLLIGGCAVCLWKSAPALQPAGNGTVGHGSSVADAPAMPGTPLPPTKPDAIVPNRGRRADPRIKGDKLTLTEVSKEEADQALNQDVTWMRRLRWVLLAAVPSSLMLGATTYITTDIAPIPLLWVLPLGLYLLSFIIVFAKVSEFVQSVVVWLEAVVVLGIGMTRVHPLVIGASPTVNGLFWFIAISLFLGSFGILFLRDKSLNHKAMILALPLLILLVTFMMLSEIKPGITDIIALHLLTLFVVAMVCHGELAHDRPAASHLTEFFLLMSVGGVVGGLFNAMFAPLAFNSLAEYPVAMVVACLLLPPLSQEQPSRASRLIDLGLAGVYVLTGIALIVLRLWKPVEPYILTGAPLENAANWNWLLAGLLLGMAGGTYLVLREWAQERWSVMPLQGKISQMPTQETAPGLLRLRSNELALLLGGEILYIGFALFAGLYLRAMINSNVFVLADWRNWLLIVPACAGIGGGLLLISHSWRTSAVAWAKHLGWLVSLTLLVLIASLIVQVFFIPLLSWLWQVFMFVIVIPGPLLFWLRYRRNLGTAISGAGPQGTQSRLLDLLGPMVLLLVGFVLIVLQFWQVLDWGYLTEEPLSRWKNWLWLVAGPLMGIAGGILLIERNWRKTELLWVSILDLAMPLALLVLVVGLIFGVYSTPVEERLTYLTEADADSSAWLPFSTGRLRLILMYGLPAILCYTCVERSFRFGLCVGAILLGSSFCNLFEDRVLLQKRSFFGVLITEKAGWFNKLLHGTTLHGQQFTADTQEELQGYIKYHLRSKGRLQELLELLEASDSAWKPYYRYYLGPIGDDESPRRLPLTYYHRTGPIGQIMAAYNTPEEKPHCGLIGLGTGTMATYCQKGQKFTFYDIDPLVVDISTRMVDEETGKAKYFTYWKDATERGANLNLIINDARLAIERQVAENDKIEKENEKRKERGEAPLPLKHEKFGVMVIDAFSSDAIPIHLITREALQLYLKILREDGIIAFHISNRYLDLKPVLDNLAEAENLAVYYNNDDREQYFGKTSSTWVALARDKKYMDRLLTLEKMEAAKDKWKDTARVLMSLPDVGGRFLPLSQGLNYAIAFNESPWKVPGPQMDYHLLPTKESADAVQLGSKRDATQREYALILDSRPDRKDYASDKQYEKKIKEYEEGYYHDLSDRRGDHKGNKTRLREYLEHRRKVGVWTDDYSNVLSVFSWR